MERAAIPFDNLATRTHHLWAKQWLLLTAGDFEQGRFNSMTIGWGSLGTMWGKPFVQVVVRPTRYTLEFMREFPSFTVCAFPEECREALQLLGTRSGRDGDKITDSGLTPVASSRVAAPGYEEASLVLECETIYWDDMKPEQFVDPDIEMNYPHKDYHRIFFGRILAAYGTPDFQA